MRLFWYGKSVSCCFLLFGCDIAKQDPDAIEQVRQIEAVYTAWPSQQLITAYELSDKLAENPSFGDSLCVNDVNKPQGYRQHFALISTHTYHRIDLIQKFNIDITKPISFAGTNKMLATHTGDFIHQQGNIQTTSESAEHAGSELIKLTFSRNGKFTGYCNETSGYVNTVNTVGENERLENFSALCSEPASVVCMSIK